MCDTCGPRQFLQRGPGEPRGWTPLVCAYRPVCTIWGASSTFWRLPTGPFGPSTKSPRQSAKGLHSPERLRLRAWTALPPSFFCFAVSSGAAGPLVPRYPGALRRIGNEGSGRSGGSRASATGHQCADLMSDLSRLSLADAKTTDVTGPGTQWPRVHALGGCARAAHTAQRTVTGPPGESKGRPCGLEGPVPSPGRVWLSGRAAPLCPGGSWPQAVGRTEWGPRQVFCHRQRFVPSGWVHGLD